MNERPWYRSRLHGQTWASLFLVVSVAIFAELRRHEDPWSPVGAYSQGWPTTYFEHLDLGPYRLGSVHHEHVSWNVPNLLLNIDILLVLIGSTIFTIERYCRRKAFSFRFSITSLMLLQAIVALSILIVREKRHSWDLGGWSGADFWLCACFVVAAGCALHVLGLLLAGLLNFAFRRSAAPPDNGRGQVAPQGIDLP